MENFLIAAAAIAIAFIAGFQCHAVTFRRRRRKQRGY